MHRIRNGTPECLAVGTPHRCPPSWKTRQWKFHSVEREKGGHQSQRFNLESQRVVFRKPAREGSHAAQFQSNAGHRDLVMWIQTGGKSLVNERTVLGDYSRPFAKWSIWLSVRLVAVTAEIAPKSTAWCGIAPRRFQWRLQACLACMQASPRTSPFACFTQSRAYRTPARQFTLCVCCFPV